MGMRDLLEVLKKPMPLAVTLQLQVTSKGPEALTVLGSLVIQDATDNTGHI
jgi:hypothetical protein